MESSTSRSDAVIRKQDEIRAQISALEAQLTSIPADNNVVEKGPDTSKRKKSEPTTLVPSTPSPKKKRRVEAEDDKRPKPRRPQPAFQKQSRPSIATALNKKSADREVEQHNTEPSTFLRKLAEVKGRPSQSLLPETSTRSSAFSDTILRGGSTSMDERQKDIELKRDDQLTLIEDFQRGPYEFTSPSDDPDFLQLEPYSGIRLLARTLPYEDFQEYMTARYYLSPSKLYSAVRLQPDKQSYDVPLFGDWVTIAVVAERGPVKITRAPVTMDADEAQEKGFRQSGKGKDKEPDVKKVAGKKYVNFKLIDFGARSKSSADGGQSVIRGDAFLSLLLFEAEGYDLIQDNGGQKPRKLYKGGSRGAFESMAKVKEGDVVALLNPRILKPFQRSQDIPHPVNNILALTPETAEAIAVIGRAHDLGMCSVVKRDGKACGSWTDRRVSDVCEYHLQNAVQHRRAGRAEFTAGTSGMSFSSTHKRKNDFNPARQWGLKPEESAQGSTYVISGHVISGSSDPRNMHVGETIGREGQAKAQRKSASAADRALKSLLKRDREGMKAVMLARETNMITSKSAKTEPGKTLGVGAKNTVDGERSSGFSKNAFTAQVVKQLGFDPTLTAGVPKKLDDNVLLKKLRTLETVGSARKVIKLGPRSGPRVRSGVVPPASTQSVRDRPRHTNQSSDTLPNDSANVVDLDEDSD